MQYRSKVYVMRVLQVVAALVAVSGLAKIGGALVNMDTGGHGGIVGAIILFVGVLVGLIATVLAKYYEAKMVNANPDKIALDALNQLGEQYAKKRTDSADNRRQLK